MQYYYKSFLLKVVPLAVFSFLSFKGYAQHSLEGRWLVNLSKSIEVLQGQDRTRYDSLPDRVKQNVQAGFSQRTFLFSGNDVIRISGLMNGSSAEITGAWSYDNSTNQLVITIGEKEHTYTLDWQDQNDVCLIYNQQREGSLLRQLCLSKTNP